MKKYLAARKRMSAVLMAGALGTFTFVAPQMADAQNAPEKIQLMAETLRARDSGNLDLAKEKAEELIKIAPEDENVQRLLASINKDLDRQESGSAVFGQATDTSVEAVMQKPVATATGSSAADSIVAAAAADQDAKIAAAETAIDEADKLAQLGAYSDAAGLLNAASTSLTLNTSTAEVLEEIEAAKANIVLTEARALAESGDAKGAEALLEEYRAAGGRSKTANALASDLDEQISDPYELAIQDISPQYVAQFKIIRDLLTRGRAQYLNGDYDGAAATFKEVEARDANNAEAKLYQTRIAEILGDIHAQNQYKTREQMLTEVDQSWERPKVFDLNAGGKAPVNIDNSILQKMKGIVIPQVNFSGMELTRVIETLSELSVEYDPEHVGVNIVPLFDANQNNPRVNISLRNLNLDRILEFVTQQVNFAYSVGGDAVTVDASDATGGESSNITEFFPISRATVIRLTGFRDGGGSSGGGSVDPFAAPSSGGGSSSPSASDEVEALQGFFQSAGVNFDVPGASLAFDGEQLIITQTSRNLERMRVILRNYNEVKQVEIESKFLEVQQGDLEELGFDWTVGDSAQFIVDGQGFPVLDQYGNPTYDNQRNFSSQNRNLSSAFTNGLQASAITINREIAGVNAAPNLTSVIDLANRATSAFTSTGWTVAGADVGLAINALSRKTGSDLMSAPKVTVLSGKRATITVAQELRYPESYGDIESTVSSGSSSNNDSGGGGSAISITAGTPQDFVTRNVGVEMTVTPNVENDDTISLILEPRVTEFEGFVEYGGPSIALDGNGTTVTVPAGFYQPIFSVREITTEVTVFDGATVVMGGLTRDEVKTVNDKVPFFGDIPGIGRLFRSEGESRQKRNLLIFVTANLVSPGGSPSRQNYRNVNANSLFQNPTIMTPAGTVNRSIEATAE
jgi:general secretion pathway protein D